MATLGEAFLEVKADTTGVGKQVERDVGQALDNAGDQGGKRFASKLKGALAGIGAALGGGAIGAFFVDATRKASDFAESANKVDVIFGDANKTINAFAKGAAEAVGLSAQKALDATTTFGAFGKQAGLSGKALSDFAIGQAQLAADLASFNNTSPDEAVRALGSAFKGEFETLDNYNILINQAAVQNEALALGLIKSKNDALDPQAKVLATQSLLLKNSTDAAGDFARTSDGLANQQRILSASFDDVKRRVGNALLPVVLQLVMLIRGGLPVFEGVANVLAGALASGLGLVVKGFAAAKTALEPFIAGLQGTGSIGGFAGTINTAGLALRALVLAFQDGKVTSDGLIGTFQRIGVTARTVFDRVREFVAVVADRLQPVLSAVAGFIADNIVPILAGLSAALGGALIGALVALAGTVGTLLVGALGAAVTALASPIVVIGLLVAAAVFAYREFEVFREVVDKVVAFFKATVVPALTKAGRDLIALFGQVLAYVKQVWPDIQAAISNVLTVLRATFLVFVKIVQELWQRFGDDLLRAARDAFENIKTVLDGAFKIVKGLFDTVIGLLSGDWKRFFDGLQSIVSGALTVIQGLLSGAFDAIKLLFGVFVSAIRLVWDGLFAALKAVGTAALEAIKGLFSAAFDAVKRVVVAVFDAIKATVSGALSTVRTAVSSGVETVRSLFADGFERARAAVVGKLAELVAGLAGKVGEVIDVMKGLPTRILLAVGNFGSLLRSAGSDLIAGLVQGITGSLGNALREVSELAGKIASTAKKALGIRSPSRVFAEIGRNVSEGLALGVESSAGMVERVVADATRALVPLSEVPEIQVDVAGALPKSAALEPLRQLVQQAQRASQQIGGALDFSEQETNLRRLAQLGELRLAAEPLLARQLAVLPAPRSGDAEAQVRSVEITDNRTFEVRDATILPALKELLDADREALLLELAAG